METGNSFSEKCHFCSASLDHVFVDLGSSPLCESNLSQGQLCLPELFFPLCAMVCANCFLVQVREVVPPEQIFSEYGYFSSFSTSWLQHAKTYCSDMIERFKLDEHSQVVEIASNDGYLLQNFVEVGIPCLGIEPAANIAAAAEKKGVPTLVQFFGADAAKSLIRHNEAAADLLIGNNVLAQVPNLNDFVAGLRIALKANGVVTMEFPHLRRLMEDNQFDTIYHEHFSYFSFLTVERLFAAHGLVIFDVQELPTHGGSLRIYACHLEDATKQVSPRVTVLRNQEADEGFTNLEIYLSFSEKVRQTKRSLLDFLITAKNEGKSIVGYGAPGKGNTLLNYCGIRTDFLDYTVDRNPYKHGRYTPGTHIPIHPPERILETRPNYVLILPWNLKDEIMEQMAPIREWGGEFVVPIPEVRVYP